MKVIKRWLIFILVVLLLSTACKKDIQLFDTWMVEEMPVSGSIPKQYEEFDKVVVDLLKTHNVPGASVALSKDGRLVLARGYGWMCRDTEKTTKPDSLFRIASVSKPITAVGVMKLVEEGKLCLEDHAFEILDIDPLQGEITDERINDITIRQLLEHSAGWDRGVSFDPLFSVIPLTRLPNDLRPLSCETLIRFMLSTRLNFTPGSRYAYSNIGYCILGEVIEEVSGMPYEEYIQHQVLAPLGITSMRIGGTLEEERVEREVCYYDYDGAYQSPSVYADGPRSVPQPYGSFYIPANAANGGWIASSIDLIRFMLAVDGQPVPPDIISKETIRLMRSRPDLEDWEASESDYYALGWEVSQIGSRMAWHHNGAMAGTHSLIGLTSDGYSAAMLFNSDPKNGTELENAMVEAVLALIDNETSWPETDLLDKMAR